MLPYTRAKASTILTVIFVRPKTRADAPPNMGFKPEFAKMEKRNASSYPVSDDK